MTTFEWVILAVSWFCNVVLFVCWQLSERELRSGTLSQPSKKRRRA